MDDVPIIPLTGLDLLYDPAPWPFAIERRAEIDAHFAQVRARQPEIWNGRVLVLSRGGIVDGVFSGAYLETDFASFLAARDWDFPDKSVRNCFAMAALRSSDGAFLLGVMSPHTATAGQIYFPAGTPDPGDVVGGKVDLERGVMRELHEETGLAPPDAIPESGWFATPYGQRIALMKIVQANEPADALRQRIRDFLDSQEKPELADIRIVRGEADLHPKMPRYVAAFLMSRLRPGPLPSRTG